jgi:uncharacterized cupredoxin-like copper-binding protein
MKANQYLVMVFLFATVESLASPQEGSSSRNTDPLFGSAAEDQTVTIDLGERSFDQQELSVVAGQTVRMLFNNPGNQPHRIVIGHDLVKFWSQNGLSDKQASADGLQKSNGGHSHELPESADEGSPLVKTVEELPTLMLPPAQTREILVRFPLASDIEYACSDDQHYAQGMVGRIRVLPDTPLPH